MDLCTKAIFYDKACFRIRICREHQADLYMPKLPNRSLCSLWLKQNPRNPWFKIGKISAIFRPKASVPSSKNQIFHKFLTYFPKTSYERRATKNGYIFASNTQVALIIEALALEFTLDVSSLAFLSGASAKKQTNTKSQQVQPINQ